MILKKKILRKDIRQSFTHSWGRFFSILCLMALGSFALVGLKVTGPNMRTTTENYFNQLNLADVSIIGSYGIDESDQKIINSANNIDKVDYGYLKDVVIQDTKTSIRIFSTPDDISLYELIDGKLPESEDEIAISNEYSDKYKIGRMINFNEAKDITGNTTLTRHEFKVVGYVNSSEIISSVNLGQTTTGTGDLKGYAVVSLEVFDSNVYMMARLTFKDTKGIDPYSVEYADLIQKHKEELAVLLEDQDERRLNSIKTDYQEKIERGQSEIGDAKQKLLNTENELKKAKEKIDEATTEISDNETTLNNTKNEISTNEITLNNAKEELSSKEREIESQKIILVQKQEEYNNSVYELEQKKTNA